MSVQAARFGLLALGAAAVCQGASQSCDDVQLGYQCQNSISHIWGQYSPYFKVDSEIPDVVPEECSVTFVQLLERHGARYPTSKKSAKYADTMGQILANVKNFTGKYAFLNNYTYSLGADILTTFGSQQSTNSGIQLYWRYRDLSDRLTPFVRASGEQRVIDSATNWTAGFHSAKSAACSNCSDSHYPYNILTISEEAGANNTLDPSTCPAFEDGFASTIGSSAQDTFAKIFVKPIMKRLNEELRGANLTQTQTIYLMDMCPFETVASPAGAVSAFCELFTEAEWLGYDYYQTLGKFYGNGPGNPLGATQGVGFVNELIGRLTATPVRDHTSTNSTLDESAATFPVGAEFQLFADFSHDNTMTSIFTALGLYDSVGMLSNTTVESATRAGGYSAAWTVPFAGRAYVEKQKCTAARGRCETSFTEYVRVIVNDRVVPLQACRSDELGRCKLDDFINGLTFAREGGDWDQCYS